MSGFESMTIRKVEPSDLQTFYVHQLDPEAIRMAAFTARDRKDKTAFEAEKRNARELTFVHGPAPVRILPKGGSTSPKTSNAFGERVPPEMTRRPYAEGIYQS